ncbi:unnamed protein product, partial [Brassica oleracea]
MSKPFTVHRLFRVPTGNHGLAVREALSHALHIGISKIW